MYTPPRALDQWFTTRLALAPETSASELLVALIHGGLRLRDGYMAIHRRALEHWTAPYRTHRWPGCNPGRVWRQLRSAAWPSHLPRSFDLVSTKAMPFGMILSRYKVAGL